MSQCKIIPKQLFILLGGSERFAVLIVLAVINAGNAYPIFAFILRFQSVRVYLTGSDGSPLTGTGVGLIISLKLAGING